MSSPNNPAATTKSSVKPIPDGMHTVTPHLVCDGAAAAIEFYKKAFNATELMRVPGPGGKLMHAAVKIGDSTVMLVDAFPEWGSVDPQALKGSPVTLHLAVANVDALFAQAVAAGCKVVMPLADMFWGDRYGSVVDPFGHNWSIATHIRDLSPEEIAQAMASQNPCPEAGK
jgi:PhnB protein